MTRWLLGLLGVGVVVLGLAFLAYPVKHIPPFDANLVRLAETNLQGYCSGDAFWKSGGNGDANLARECRVRRSKKRSNEANMLDVQPAFCEGIVNNGWEGTVQECIVILEDNEYWPTFDGNITNSWNRARPYPRFINSAGGGSKGDNSRTGGRQDNGERENNPTHTVPSYGYNGAP